MAGTMASISASHQRRLRLQATTDGLTGLPNRILFRDRADQALAMARRHHRQIAVMLIDLDRFKEVNDTLGHQCGDELLRDVAQRLEVGVRDTDTVARIGGDEFAVVLSETVGSEGAIKAAERLSAAAFTHQRLIANVPLNVRASIGIALYPDHGADIDELLHHADVAMYHAKRNQLPMCLYNVNVDPNSPDRLDIISELEAGIERSELVLHYEPKFNIEEAALVGVEALVRWNHPIRGLLDPSDFREVAKTAGLIPSLTRYVLREATGQLRQWSDEGRDLTVTVNMSHRSLIDPTFLDDVEQAIASSGIDPPRLTLEITEDLLHDNPEQAIVVLNALRKQGVTISLDSFSTGFSSMTYLQRLPIDEVKIDQNFIRDLPINPADQAMVRSTIELGHSLSHVVTAQGVTDSGTLHQLREMGCDLAQGVLLGRPAPADQLTSLLDNPNISASTSHT